jgi:hypothetical protein
MTRPSDTENRRRGRPKTTGSGMQISPRWSLSEIENIDQWAVSNGKPAREEAIRRIVNQVTGAPRAIAVLAPAGGPPMSRQEERLLKAAPVCANLHTSSDTRIDASEEVGKAVQVKRDESTEGSRMMSEYNSSLEELGRRTRAILEKKV